MSYLLIQNLRPMGGAPVDVCVEDGVITEIANNIEVPPEAKIEDGKGHLLVPGFVDAHMHLDKTFWGLP